MKQLQIQKESEIEDEMFVIATEGLVRITNGTIYNETYYYLNDKLIAMKDGSGNKVYYHPDHLGSTTLVTNQSGDVVEDNTYLPYGAPYSGLGLSRFLYTGQELDKGTGFMDYGARLYYPLFMHFLQCDPVKQDIYDPQALNCYSYVLNNPYKYVDPNGLWAVFAQGGLAYAVPGAGASVSDRTHIQLQ